MSPSVAQAENLLTEGKASGCAERRGEKCLMPQNGVGGIKTLSTDKIQKELAGPSGVAQSKHTKKKKKKKKKKK